MKLKYEFETTELGDEIIAVPVGENASEFGGIINLNSTAAEILKLLHEDTTTDKIVSSLLEEYEGTKEEITAFVVKFIDNLKEQDLLIE